MAEVAVAFPNDETSTEVIASRLRSDGIAARVDRGLIGSTWQASASALVIGVVAIVITVATR